MIRYHDYDNNFKKMRFLSCVLSFLQGFYMKKFKRNQVRRPHQNIPIKNLPCITLTFFVI